MLAAGPDAVRPGGVGVLVGLLWVVGCGHHYRLTRAGSSCVGGEGCVSRGDPKNKRTRDVRVRLTPAEWQVWDAAREGSGRREMGAWLRALVTAVLTGTNPGRRPGDLPRVSVPEVNRAAVDELRRIGNNLNQLAHVANAERRLGDVEELRRVLGEVEDALRLVRGQRPPRVVPLPRAGDGAEVEQAVVGTSSGTAAERAAAVLARVRGGQEGVESPRRRWFGGRS